MLIPTPLILIFLLLLYGCYTDLKDFHVSNNVTYPIAILALLMFNPQAIVVKAAYILFLVVSWYVGQVGSADVKVITPIVLMLAPISFIVFAVSFSVSGVIIGLGAAIKTGIRSELKGFFPITIAYVVAIVSWPG